MNREHQARQDHHDLASTRGRRIRRRLDDSRHGYAPSRSHPPPALTCRPASSCLDRTVGSLLAGRQVDLDRDDEQDTTLAPASRTSRCSCSPTTGTRRHRCGRSPSELGVTKAALYYHFKTQGRDRHEPDRRSRRAARGADRVGPDAAADAGRRARSSSARYADELHEGRHHDTMRFFERNQTALRDHPSGERMRELMMTLIGLLSRRRRRAGRAAQARAGDLRGPRDVVHPPRRQRQRRGPPGRRAGRRPRAGQLSDVRAVS